MGGNGSRMLDRRKGGYKREEQERTLTLSITPKKTSLINKKIILSNRHTLVLKNFL